jgi:hypothetical protein
MIGRTIDHYRMESKLNRLKQLPVCAKEERGRFSLWRSHPFATELSKLGCNVTNQQ